VTLLANTLDRRLTLTTSLDARCASVVGDPTQLQSVFLNLGLNASQAMTGDGELSIRSQNVQLHPSDCEASPFAIQPGPYVEIEVRDTGSGIAPKDLDRIFEPFFTTKEPGKGTGLGLSAVLGSIQQHGGAITVTSHLGEGTCFRILRPVVLNEHPKTDADNQAVHGHGRILLVDDEELVRSTCHDMLKGLGYDVLLAKDGREGLELFRRQHHRIDLVLLDMVMPGLNGRDCFVQMREIDSAMPIIITSGFARDEDLAPLMAEGLTVSVSKPYRRVNLSQAIADALANRRNGRETPPSPREVHAP
jgi:CheY-like chemotaxis protein